MSDVIQLLPDSVANQIAAGEVIQRPASVVKELVENAIDAGAKTIHVFVVDAGRTSIQVIDDGKGMSDTDARLSFERHATSKIRKADDLFNLHTMGFRGEALASIAAVAQVELRTRMETEDVGTHLNITGSVFQNQEPCSCPVGSNFLVENLFFNVPARRKFLKSNSTELSNILAAFDRIVLVNPQITFTLHSNGSELFHLKAGALRQRILDVFGKRLNQDLLPIHVDTTMCKINGFVGKPESAHKRGVQQFFFVNDRYMRHPYFNKAVATAYDRLIPIGEQVPYFIYFEVNPEDIDVNIHPTKTEIKFENEQAVWQILSAAVREAIGVFTAIPTIDFDTQGKPDIPVFGSHSENVQMPKVDYNPQYNPFDNTRKTSKTQSSAEWEQLYEGLKTSQDHETEIFDAPELDASQESEKHRMLAEKSPVHYQYKGKYVMTTVKSGLMIIDQHRAHVRILYERYMQQVQAHRNSAQKLLFPEVIQMSVSESVIFHKVLPEMTSMGFELTDLGGNSYAINAIPADLEGVDAVLLVRDMIASATEKDASAVESIYSSLALSMARNAAIPQGQVLSNDEMEELVNGLFACSNVNYTPDGKNVLCILKQQEIEHLLG